MQQRRPLDRPLADPGHVGRFGHLIPILALAGSIGAKRKVPRSLGTLPTGGVTFSALLVGTIVIVGALSFFASLALGPIAEQLALNAGN
jgi:potassium-transporting ATPase potassium-binding subunit